MFPGLVVKIFRFSQVTHGIASHATHVECGSAAGGRCAVGLLLRRSHPHPRHESTKLPHLGIRAVGECLVPVDVRRARDISQLDFVRAQISGEPLLCVGNLESGPGRRRRLHRLFQGFFRLGVESQEIPLEYLVVDRHLFAAPDQCGAAAPVDIEEICYVEFGNRRGEGEDVVGPDRDRGVPESLAEANEKFIHALGGSVRRGHPECFVWCIRDRRDP